jgi:lipopolysaccharide/colanic/teichoic acid biosynthesis glycosyltransferase
MEFHGDEPIGSVSHDAVQDDVVSAIGLDEWTKRVFDIVVATMGLILFSPILLITSIAIKLVSRGPIFIREIPYGYNNRSIQVLKFRVVRACVEATESTRA